MHVLAILLSVAATLLIIWSGRRTVVAPIITITWVLHCTLWFLVPLFVQTVLTEPVVNSAGPFTRDQLSVLSSFMLLAIVIAHLGLRHPYVVPVTRFFDEHAPPLDKLFWPMTIATLALVAIERTLSSVQGASFAETVAFAVTADTSQQAQSGILGTFQGMLIGFAIAVISLGLRSGLTKGTLFMAWMSVAAFCGFAIARGARSIVLLPIFMGLVTVSTMQGRNRRRATLLVGIGGMAVIVVGAPLAAIMGVARGGTGGISLQLIEDAVFVVFGSRGIDDQVQLLAGEVNRKFDVIGPGVELLAMEPPGDAGLIPFVSASLSPIPRILFPNKPVPISRDGTYLGTPYRVAAKAYGNVEVGMVVPVSASAISVWEFGSVGPLILLIMNLIALVLLDTVFMTKNVLARSLGVSMLGLPTAEFFVGTPSLIQQNSLRLILMLSILAVVLLGWRMLWPGRGALKAATPVLAKE